ncbi:putative RDD family membrane protein YckC [Streptomyces afghaniensis]|nr:putative RDD family membrane protein YckC [Streptomyces afghaniensis]
MTGRHAAQERGSAVMTLFLLVVLAAVALGIIGVAADGLGYLLAVGIMLFAVDVIFFAVLVSRRAGRRPVR